MIHDQRIKQLNHLKPNNRQYILYWMQAAQRVEYNHALEYAIDMANSRGKPLIVYFGITPNFPEANLRHYTFMLQGLKDVHTALKDRKIKMIIRLGSPEKGVLALADYADCTVVDRGYLKIQKQWRHHAAQYINSPLIQIESDVIVPVETVSKKEEYSAATIRKKIHKIIDHFLVPCTPREIKVASDGMDISSLDINSIEDSLPGLHTENSIKPVSFFHGGKNAAASLFEQFLETKLDRYAECRNNPDIPMTSDLSPYLHFGQISPLWIALNVLMTQSAGSEVFLEQLIIRRELAINFVHYNQFYDSCQGLPDWCQKTLALHSGDTRDYLYSREDLENAETHDPYWNAAQIELLLTGKMHNYMRMYWGKKIIEWSTNPEKAYQTALYLNNTYGLDGRDPNSFAGVAWCFGKHDRPWSSRPVFGSIRYMNDKGLKRKFDMNAYIERINKLKNKLLSPDL